jgi:ribosomal protein S13
MCMYGGSTDPAARNMIQGIKNIIHEGIGKRSIHDVCEDIHEYYEREIRHHVDDQKEWTVESIKKHILETETDVAIAMELDMRSIVQCMQHLRDHMIDDTTNMLYGPHLNSYIKLSAHLHKIASSNSKK